MSLTFAGPQILFSFGGAFLESTQELISTLVLGIPAATTNCQVVNNNVHDVQARNSVGIFADSSAHYVAENFSCNNGFFNYSLVEQPFIASQANARGVDNIDCSLTNPDTVEVINSKVDILLQGTDGGGCCPTEITAAGLAPTPTIITGDIIITNSGTYCLAKNTITPSLGIQISASNVVLDLGGHTLYGRISINNFVNAAQNITIKNGTIITNSSNFSIALGGASLLHPVTDIIIDNITFINGISNIATTGLPQLTNLTVTNCRFSNYGTRGISCSHQSTGVQIDNCYFQTNKSNTTGLFLSASSNSTITNNQFASTGNSNTLACSMEFCTNITVDNCVSQGALIGIQSKATNQVTIKNCSLVGAGSGVVDGKGFDLEKFSTPSNNISLINCSAVNFETGFYIDGITNITVENCLAQNNKIGFSDVSTLPLTINTGFIRLCTAEGNTQYGFYIPTTANSQIAYTENIAYNNGADYNPVGAPFNARLSSQCHDYLDNIRTDTTKDIYRACSVIENIAIEAWSIESKAEIISSKLDVPDACAATPITQPANSLIDSLATGNYCLATDIAATVSLTNPNICLCLNNRQLTGTLIVGAENACVSNGTIFAPAPTTALQAALAALTITTLGANAQISNVNIACQDTTAANVPGRTGIKISANNVTIHTCSIQSGSAGSNAAGGHGIECIAPCSHARIRETEIVATGTGNNALGGNGIQINADCASIEVRDCTFISTGTGTGGVGLAINDQHTTTIPFSSAIYNNFAYNAATTSPYIIRNKGFNSTSDGTNINGGTPGIYPNVYALNS
jgi:hypothetical protein